MDTDEIKRLYPRKDGIRIVEILHRLCDEHEELQREVMKLRQELKDREKPKLRRIA